MADDLSKTGPGDRSRVNVDQEHELRYWTRAWGVSPEQLREAVRRVGPMADDVAKELGKPRP
jgi:hypothetical protein